MQKPKHTREIRKRINEEIRRLQEKIKNTKNPRLQEYYYFQIAQVVFNPEQYFELIKTETPKIYKFYQALARLKKAHQMHIANDRLSA